MPPPLTAGGLDVAALVPVRGCEATTKPRGGHDALAKCRGSVGRNGRGGRKRSGAGGCSSPVATLGLALAAGLHDSEAASLVLKII